MIKTVMLAGAVALGVAAAGYVCVLAYARHDVIAREEAARAAGYPTTLSELDAWYALPEGSANAADVYAKAFALDEASSDVARENSLPFVGEASLPEFSTPLRETDRTAAAAYLTERSEVLSVLHEAASISACRYPIQLAETNSGDLPHIASLRRAVHLLALEAAVAAEEGQADTAVLALVAGYVAAASLREEPLVHSQVGRVGQIHHLTLSLERVLNRVPLANVQLIQIQNAIASCEAPHAFERAFAGDRCRGMAVLATDTAGMTDGGTATPFGRLYGALGLRKLDAWVYAACMGDLIAAAEGPYHQRRARYRMWTSRVEKVPEWLAVSSRRLGECAKAASADLRAAALIRVARTAVAIQIYRNDNQTLPASLDALAPTYVEVVPGDPFGTAPLQYERVGMRAEVSSIGLDGLPNSGLSTDDDIVLSVMR